jgi:general secretion pathway protein A
VGQPELDEKLDSQQLRQLKQRIGLRCTLKPMNLEQVRGYVQRRLEVAGANSQAATIFPDDVMQMISKFSRGIPRLINTLCENSLLSGFGQEQKSITPEIVQEVVTDLRLDRVPPGHTRNAYDVALPTEHRRSSFDVDEGPKPTDAAKLQ